MHLHSAACFQPAPRLYCLAERPFQSSWRTGPMGRASQPAWRPLPCAPGTAQPLCCPHPHHPKHCQSSQGGEQFCSQRCVRHTGTCQGWRAHLHAHPALTHLCPFHQLETLQPFGWLSAAQPGQALGAEAHPVCLEQQLWGRMGTGRHHSPIPL